MRSIAVEGTTVTASLPAAASLVPELLRGLDAAGVPVASAEVARATLDDVFLALTGRSLREGGADANPGDPASRSIESVEPPAPSTDTRVLEEQAS